MNDSLRGVLQTFDLSTTDFVMILIGIPLFIILWKLLEANFLLPYLKLIEARENAIQGKEKEAQAKEEKSEVLLKEYEERITEERVQAMAKKIAVLNSAQEEANKIIEAAESEAQNYLQKVRKDVLAKKKSIRETALKEADSLAVLIGKKVRESLSQSLIGSSFVQ